MNFVEDKEWKNSLLMVSKVGSVRNGVLDLWGVYGIPCMRERERESKHVARRGGVGRWIDKGIISQSSHLTLVFFFFF